MRIQPKFLTSTERAELMSCVRSHRADHGIARRANAILLLDEGKSCEVIAEFLYLDDDTVRSWIQCAVGTRRTAKGVGTTCPPMRGRAVNPG
jgi:DNA-binding NarL/FixJ family response regulator